MNDIRCGTDLDIYGKRLRVVDCDAYTKSYFSAELNASYGTVEDYPKDLYDIKREEFMSNETGADLSKPRGSKLSPEKLFMEAQLGKFMTTQSLRSFLDNDKSVLRFYAVWDDKTLYGTQEHFTIHFFLTDNSMEIVEDKIKGKDPFPLLLSRQRLPLDYHTLPDVGVVTVDNKHFYTASNFSLGGFINVYGRRLKLYDADAYTKQWYGNPINVASFGAEYNFGSPITGLYKE